MGRLAPGLLRDPTHTMWDLSAGYLWRAAPWLAAHAAGSRAVKSLRPRWTSRFHALGLCAYALWRGAGASGLAYLLALPVACHAAAVLAGSARAGQAVAWAGAGALVLERVLPAPLIFSNHFLGARI